eukprot:scaffold50576_cov506-Isochrysis_galbana.AAC.1
MVRSPAQPPQHIQPPTLTASRSTADSSRFCFYSGGDYAKGKGARGGYFGLNRGGEGAFSSA